MSALRHNAASERAWEAFMSATHRTDKAAEAYEEAVLLEQAAWEAYQRARGAIGPPEVAEGATGAGGAS